MFVKNKVLNILKKVKKKWKNSSMFLEEKVLYRTLKGSISAPYLEPLKVSTLLKKGFLWVLYRTLGFHTWPIEPFTKKNGSIYQFGVPYMNGDGTTSGSK